MLLTELQHPSRDSERALKREAPAKPFKIQRKLQYSNIGECFDGSENKKCVKSFINRVIHLVSVGSSFMSLGFVEPKN